MDRKNLNISLNVGLYLAFLGLLFTGIHLGWTTARGMQNHAWEELHEKLALLFTVGALAHLWLHWAWIKAVVLGGANGRLWLGAAGLGLVLALTLPWVL
jgi:hypothetical protein